MQSQASSIVLDIVVIYKKVQTDKFIGRLASVGILGKEREPWVGKLGWYGNFHTGFEKEYLAQNPVCGFFELFWNSDCCLLV